MDQAQEQHLASLLDEFRNLFSAKYRKGAAEHGGGVWENSPITLLDFAIEEAIDQVAYLLTIRQQLSGTTVAEILKGKGEYKV